MIPTHSKAEGELHWESYINGYALISERFAESQMNMGCKQVAPLTPSWSPAMLAMRYTYFLVEETTISCVVLNRLLSK